MYKYFLITIMSITMVSAPVYADGTNSGDHNIYAQNYDFDDDESLS